ncbi:hypothetical protein DL768_001614 [Monosporascus sp. mg162]|nr:hypothetical protein DL768_001614 [Monosporascus sp. mg162]
MLPPQVPSAVTHQRDSSGASDLSMAISNFSIQSYTDDFMTLEFRPPQYRTIPWSNQGSGKLTVQLALFYLCMLGATVKKLPRNATAIEGQGSGEAEPQEEVEAAESRLSEKQAESGSVSDNPLLSLTDIHYDESNNGYYETAPGETSYAYIDMPVFDYDNNIILYYRGGRSWSRSLQGEAAHTREKGKQKDKKVW